MVLGHPLSSLTVVMTVLGRPKKKSLFGEEGQGQAAWAFSPPGSEDKGHAIYPFAHVNEHFSLYYWHLKML